MNKTYKSGMMALSAVVFLTSCSENESLQQAHLSTDQINFIASMAHQWDANTKSAPQNPSSRSAGVRDNEAPIHVNANLAKPLYLHPVVQDGIHIWSKQGTPITRSGAPIEDVEQERVVQTRGSKKDKLSDYTSFNVSAVNTHDNPESLFFGYQKAASVTSNSTTTWHVSDGIKCWPEAPATLSFYAYAPDNSMVTVESGDDAAGVKTVHYKATTPVTDQPDLIVSSAAESRPSNAKPTTVNLPFYHALTAVTFSVDAAMMPGTLTKVELVNVNTEGDCTMTASATPSFSWSNQKTPSTFSFDFNQPVGSSAVTLTSGEKTLMMVPQTLPTDAKVNFTFTLNNGVSQTLSAPIGGNGKTWEAGKSIIYKLSTNAVSTISAASVSFPTTWNDIAVTSATDKVSYPKSTFDNGESIGLYVVDEAGQLVGSNIKLTKNTDGWKLDGNDKFMLLTRYKYFAYYPYSTTAPTVNVSADNAAAFFASKISSLSLKDDQRDKSDLLAQDFQVATGLVGPNASTLTFQMEHSMGLAVLNLEEKSIAKTRRFYTNNYTYYYPDLPGHATIKPTEGKDKDYTDDAAKMTVSASTNFEGYKPYNVPGTTKHLQVIPLNKKASFMAADQDRLPRTAWGKLSTYSITPKTSVPVVLKNIQTDADFYYLARVYTCTQSVASFTTPVAGDYMIECWGAQGSNMLDKVGGKGGYCKGTVKLPNRTIYIYVGAQAGGFGGGGITIDHEREHNFGNDGGGATDIRLVKGSTYKEFNSLKSRIIVAAGGGGANHRNTIGEVPQWGQGDGGYGGGLNGGDGFRDDNTISWATVPYCTISYGAQQKQGGRNYQNTVEGGVVTTTISGNVPYWGRFGFAPSETEGARVQSGGGGGYYAGCDSGHAGGSGGSSFISGHSGCDAITESSTENAIVHTGQPNHYSGLVFTDTQMIDGAHPMPSPYGGTEIGHSRDGACVISWFLK